MDFRLIRMLLILASSMTVECRLAREFTYASHNRNPAGCKLLQCSIQRVLQYQIQRDANVRVVYGSTGTSESGVCYCNRSWFLQNTFFSCWEFRRQATTISIFRVTLLKGEPHSAPCDILTAWNKRAIPVTITWAK
jgi:hypothetical protein